MKEWTLIDWAENAALENLKARLAAIDHLSAQANSLLQLLLVGMGGSLAYGVKVFEPATVSPLVAGSFAVSLWLAWVGAVLIVKCIMTQEQPVAHNSPKNLYQPEMLTQYSPEEWRKFELDNQQGRIDAVKRLNWSMAWWLDRCRLAAIATPLVFCASTAVALWRS